MSATIQSYVVSPSGKARGWLGALFIGLPMLLLWTFCLNPQEDYHLPQDWLERSLVFVGAVLLCAAFFRGIDLIFIRRLVTVDPGLQKVLAETCVFGFQIRQKTWILPDFRKITVKQSGAGETTDWYRQDIGLSHVSGKIIWLTAFNTPTKTPTPEMAAFLVELEKNTGLACEPPTA